jgi:hypothetical protein
MYLSPSEFARNLPTQTSFSREFLFFSYEYKIRDEYHRDEVIGSFIKSPLLGIKNKDSATSVLLQIEVVGRMNPVEPSPVSLNCELQQTHLEGNGVHNQVLRLLSKHQLVHKCIIALLVTHSYLKRYGSICNEFLLSLSLLL